VKLSEELKAEVISKVGEEHDLTSYVSDCKDYAVKHMQVIERFGRFPHRNDVLGREYTEEELEAQKDGSLMSFF